MTMSPGASCATSRASSSSTSAAGTIIQIARGGAIFATSSCSEAAPIAPSPCEQRDGGGLNVVDDAVVALLQQAPHHARPHSSETDHSELHRWSLSAL